MYVPTNASVSSVLMKFNGLAVYITITTLSYHDNGFLQYHYHTRIYG